MSRIVVARVRHRPDRSMSVVVDGPDGPVDAGVTSRSADIGPLARQAAVAVHAGEEIQVQVSVDPPPWLREGMLAEIGPDAIDPHEGATHPYGQVTGFLAVGGVLVTHPETGTGVYPAEALTPVAADTVPAAVLDGIVGRTGVPPVALA